MWRRVVVLVALMFPWTAQAGPPHPSLESLQAAWAPREQARIRAHLAAAEAFARARDVGHLSPEVRARRAAALDTLAAYREAGRFPRNQTSSPLQPMFVDPAGVRCAMGELIWQSGATELVREVATHRNDAYVAQLAPALAPWLAENGLTLEEAARIQPEYSWCYARSQWLCPGPDTHVAEVAVVSLVEPGDDDRRPAVLRVEEVVRGTKQTGQTVEARRRGVPLDPAARYLGVRMANADGWALHGLDAARQVWLVADPCGDSPRLPLARALEVMDAPDCQDRLQLADTRWAGGWCSHINGTHECGTAQEVGEVALPPQPSPAAPLDEPTLDRAASCAAAAPSPLGAALVIGLLAGLVRRRAVRRAQH